MTLAFVSLGSNIAPERNLPRAAAEIATVATLLAVSRVYASPAVGRPEQPAFLNGAVLIETGLRVEGLKDVLVALEKRLGRVRQVDRYAPRTIDLDIVLFGEACLTLHGRQIPDPELLEYAHLAVPVAELSPAHRHPLTGRTLREIAAAMTTDALTLCHEVSLWPTRPLQGGSYATPDRRSLGL